MSDQLENWSLADMPDMSGRNAIVTGANSGIGFHTALELARAGANVTLAVRNLERGDAAAARIRSEVARANVEVARLDLADLSSVRAFASSYIASHSALHLLVNNAGIMAAPARAHTVDGFEVQIGAMHFGHFALTGLLWPLLAKTENARVVAVSSIVHKTGRIDFENLDGQKSYSPNAIYSQAKLANLMFGLELHRRCESAGISVRSVIAHPGVAATNLQTTGLSMGGKPALSARLLAKLAPKLFQPASRGAIPVLYAAAAPDAESGAYYGPDGCMEMGGAHPRRAIIARQGLDRDVAKGLWDISAARTNIPFL